VRRKSPTTIEELADRLDLGPEHVPLLRLALVHRSLGEVAATNNERLEFLGDSVLGMLTNEYLYEKYPTSSEGDLTRMKANVVNKTSLARAARPLGLGQLLDMARSEEVLGGRDRSSTLADAFEAVLGSIYLNAGLDAARRFVQTYLFPEVDLTRSWDYKSTLQEQLQERFRSAPDYRIISETGPAHAKEFIAEVYLNGELLGTGRGGSKKQAEQVAAAEALMFLATRAKKTRRTRQTAPADAPITVPDGPHPAPVDAAEASAETLPEVDAAAAPAPVAAPEAPTAPLKTFQRPRKKAVPGSPASVAEAVPVSPDAVQPGTTSTAESETPSPAPTEPARRVRRPRKVAADATVPDASDTAPPPVAAAETAPKRGRRVAKSARAVEVGEASVAEPDDVAAASAPPTPAEASAPARARVRKKKLDVALPAGETTSEGN
jgi:ribonuclease III